MLTFTLYADDHPPPQAVEIDPAAVASVLEAARRPASGGWRSVAVISLTTGAKYTVEDDDRTAARLIQEARRQESGGAGI